MRILVRCTTNRRCVGNISHFPESPFAIYVAGDTIGGAAWRSRSRSHASGEMWKIALQRSSDLSGRINGSFSLIKADQASRHLGGSGGSEEFGFELARRHRPSEEIALSLFAAHPDQEVGCGSVLNAFGDDRQAQLLGEANGRTDDRRVVGIGQQAQDERAVDLQPVERKFLQVAQAGKSGAEIVEHEANAKLLNLKERFQRTLLVVEQDVFGDFELEAGWTEAGAGEHLRNREGEVAGLELRRRKIDTDAELVSRAFPGGALGASGLKDPFGDPLRNRRGVDDRHEFRGRNQTTHGMTPADQGFGADQSAVGQMKLWLVEQFELIAIRRQRQLRF